MQVSEIRQLIETIADPEIPVLNLGDLGIIRDICCTDDVIKVTISPTYTGCPATKFIETMVADKLTEMGIDKFEIIQSIAPPWSSDWISEEGRKKLLAYGIAPPNPIAKGSPESCPRCHSTELTRLSEFGATPCQALWRCLDCLENFSYFKCI